MELFGYRLASLLGVWHPDHLLDCLTAEQFSGWERFYDQEPFGELRQDLRGVAHVLALTGNGQDIELMHPYFKEGETLFEKHRELEARRSDPALQTKLKAAREKHIAEIKARGTR